MTQTGSVSECASFELHITQAEYTACQAGLHHICWDLCALLIRKWNTVIEAPFFSWSLKTSALTASGCQELPLSCCISHRCMSTLEQSSSGYLHIQASLPCLAQSVWRRYTWHKVIDINSSNASVTGHKFFEKVFSCMEEDTEDVDLICFGLMHTTHVL